MTEQQPKDRPNVTSMRTDKEVATSLDGSIAMLGLYQDDFPANGIVRQILIYVLSILQYMRSGRTDSQVDQAMTMLLDFLAKLSGCLSAKPFDNAGLEDLEKLGASFIEARRESEELKAANTKLVGELEKAATSGQSRSEMVATQASRIKELETRLEEALGNNLERLNRLEPALGGIARTLSGKLEFAEDRHRLETEVQELRRQKGSQITGDVERVMEILSSIGSITETIRTKTNPPASATTVTVEEVLSEPTTQDKAVLDVTNEIKRRHDWLHEISESIQHTGGQLDDLQEHRSELESMRDSGMASDASEIVRLSEKIEMLLSHQKELLGLERQVRAHLKVFEKYKSALEVIDQKVPPELIEQNLPAIPTLSDIPIEMPREITEQTRQQHSAHADAPQNIGISQNGILIITLFECFADWWANNKMGKPLSQRGMVGFASSALKAGIAQRYGFESVQQLLNGWNASSDGQDDPTRKYLHYCGTMGGGARTYKRTSTPLPWAVSKLVTEQEISDFLSMVIMPQSPPK